MAKYREDPCMYYICKGQCKKGMDADHKGHCQHCSKYRARARVRHINQKKIAIQKEKARIMD